MLRRPASRRFALRKALLVALLSVLLVSLAPAFALAADEPSRRLALEAPDELTVGLLPKRLALEAAPSSIQTGLDCGMPEMCGLDPCLCGIPDAYGACACNGTEATVPALSVASGDPDVARIVRLGTSYWVMPWAGGETTLTVEAALPHHEAATARVEVSVEAPFAPVLLPVGALLAALVGVGLVLRRLVGACDDGERSDSSGDARGGGVSGVRDNGAGSGGSPGSTGLGGSSSGSTGSGVAVATAALLILALILAPVAGCSPSADVTDASPRPASASVTSAGDGTEAGQRVEVRITFDKALAATGDVADDLDLALNGKPLDSDTIAASASLEGDDTLLVLLVPAEGTGGPTSARYFAVYEGVLSVSARAASGGFAHLAAAKSQASVVIDAPLSFQIPSGLVIEPVESVVGDASSGTVAQAGFRVICPPRIRAVAWFTLEPGGERILVHNHEFAAYADDAAGRERYAAYLTEPLKRGLGSGYVVSAEGDTVTIAAYEPTDGQSIVPALYEGVVE